MVYYNQGTEICKSKIYYNGPFSAKSFIDTDDVPQTISASISPNPNSGEFYITVQGNIFGNVHATIINMLGEPVYETTVNKSLGIQSYPINVSQLVQGVYTIQLDGDNNERVSVKLVIAK
jgi:Secretion system C-terminal sorting domain